MRSDMFCLIADILILRLLLRGTTRMTLVGEVFLMNRLDMTRDRFGLRIPLT